MHLGGRCCQWERRQLRWLQARGLTFPSEVFSSVANAAASKGRLEVLKFLHQEGNKEGGEGLLQEMTRTHLLEAAI